MEFKANIWYEIYNDANNRDDFYVGRHITQDDEYAVFQCVNSNGFNDGLFFCKTDSIYRVEFNTDYCQAVEKLITYRKTEFKNLKFNTKNLLSEVLTFAKDTKAIVSIELENTGSIELLGFIENFSDCQLTTLEISTSGIANGNGIVRLNDIKNITIDSYKNLKCSILFNLNNNC